MHVMVGDSERSCTQISPDGDTASGGICSSTSASNSGNGAAAAAAAASPAAPLRGLTPASEPRRDGPEPKLVLPARPQEARRDAVMVRLRMLISIVRRRSFSRTSCARSASLSHRVVASAGAQIEWTPEIERQV